MTESNHNPPSVRESLNEGTLTLTRDSNMINVWKDSTKTNPQNTFSWSMSNPDAIPPANLHVEGIDAGSSMIKLTYVGFNTERVDQAKVTSVDVDLKINDLPEEWEAEPNEEKPGLLLALNDDDDNDNDVPDKDEAPVNKEDDLVQGTLVIKPNNLSVGKVTLTAPSDKIQAWTKKDKSGSDGNLLATGSKEWDLATEKISSPVFFEGIKMSESAQDIDIELKFKNGDCEIKDVVKATVASVDLDSGNIEDEKEDVAGENAVFMVNNDDDDANDVYDFNESPLEAADDDLLELPITCAALPDGGELKLEIIEGAEYVKLWDDAKKTNELDYPQTWVPGSDDPPPESVFAEAIAETPGAANVKIRLTYSLNDEEIVRDEVWLETLNLSMNGDIAYYIGSLHTDDLTLDDKNDPNPQNTGDAGSNEMTTFFKPLAYKGAQVESFTLPYTAIFKHCAEHDKKPVKEETIKDREWELTSEPESQRESAMKIEEAKPVVEKYIEDYTYFQQTLSIDLSDEIDGLTKLLAKIQKYTEKENKDQYGIVFLAEGGVKKVKVIPEMEDRCQTPAQTEIAEFKLFKDELNLRIDSDNSGEIDVGDAGKTEDAMEETPPGKMVQVNTGDVDGDGVLDTVDYDIPGSNLFAQLKISIDDEVELDKCKIAIQYDPEIIRVWTKPAHSEEPRSKTSVLQGGDVVPSIGLDPLNNAYTTTDLLGEGKHERTLYVEALTKSAPIKIEAKTAVKIDDEWVVGDDDAVLIFPVDVDMDAKYPKAISGEDLPELQETNPGLIMPVPDAPGNKKDRAKLVLNILPRKNLPDGGKVYLKIKDTDGEDVRVKIIDKEDAVWLDSSAASSITDDKAEELFGILKDGKQVFFAEAINPGNLTLVMEYENDKGTIIGVDELSFTLLRTKMTAYRQETNYFQRTKIPDDKEENPGAGVRLNGDDDNNNGIPDKNETSSQGEDDLIEVELEVGIASTPPNIEYVLKRNNAKIKVWNNSLKNTSVLDANSEAVLNFSNTTKTLWVEGVIDGTSDLEFIARLIDGEALCMDKIHFYSFSSVIIGLSGEVSMGGSPLNNGMYNVAKNLYNNGYDIHYYDEDTVAQDGSGQAYNESVSAIKDRNVEQIAIYGHSHGGGSTYDLADRLNTNKASIGSFTISFTGYVDAIENDRYIDTDSESRLPPSTLYHMNYYQPNGWLHGVSITGANINLDVTTKTWGASLSHTTIDNDNTVITKVTNQISSNTIK